MDNSPTKFTKGSILNSLSHLYHSTVKMVTAYRILHCNEWKYLELIVKSFIKRLKFKD